MSQTVAPPPTPGDQVGPYTLQGLLGVGGMATVYKGVDDTGAVYAIKILHPGKAETDEIKRFRREFLALKDLRHPSVVAVFEAGVTGDYPWIALEYVDGSDLGSLVDRWTANPPPDRFAQAERIFRGLCEGLAYIHEKGLIHRDLKPSNVLVSSGGSAKLTDFGVVKAPGAFTTQLTVAGKLVGTVAFMSPEQITGDPVTPKSDLYSLGAVLYVLLTLRRPIEADNIAGYLARHITETPRLPSEIDPNVPPHLERICMDLLEKEAQQRPESAANVLKRLEGVEIVERKVLHGRDAERDAILGAMKRLAASSGGVFFLRGPLGSGRTSLLELAHEAARREGFVVAATSGARAEVEGQLLRQLGGTATAPNWTDIGSAAAQAPTVVLIDDLDHMRSASIQGLTEMVREQVAIKGAPILLMASVTNAEGVVAGLCSGVETGLSPDEIILGALQRPAIISIVREQGLSGAMGAALGRRLDAELDGMPGGVVEQVAALVQAGWLIPTPDGGLRAGCSMESLRNDPLPLPDRIRRAEAVRIEALDDPSRALFEALVVLDMEATTELVGEIADLEQGALDQHLNTLLKAGLIRQRTEGVHQVVALSGDRHRDVAYGLIEKQRRSALHRRVAEALRRRARRRSGTFAEVIASHLLSGGQVGEAYPMLLVAAETTLRNGKLRSTAKLLEKADRARQVAEGQMPENNVHRYRRRLYTIQGLERYRSGDPSRSLEAWNMALESARAEGDAEGIARSQAGVGLAREAMGDVLSASGSLERALGTLPQGDPMWAEAGEALARSRLARADLDGAQRLWKELLSLGKEMGEGEVHARAMAGLGLISLVHGETEKGQDSLENAVFRMRGQANQKLLPVVQLHLAGLAHADGRLEDARDLAIDAEATARGIAQLRSCAQAIGLAAQVLYDLGIPHEARGLAQDAATLARAQGQIDTVPAISSALYAARVLVSLDAVEDLQGLLPTSVPALGRDVVGVDDPVGGLLGVRSRVVLKRNPAVAVALARQVLDRPSAALPWSAVRHLLDAAHTLIGASDSRGKEAIERASALLKDSRYRLLQLETSLLADRIGFTLEGMPSSVDLLQTLDQELGSPEGFKARWASVLD